MSYRVLDVPTALALNVGIGKAKDNRFLLDTEKAAKKMRLGLKRVY